MASSQKVSVLQRINDNISGNDIKRILAENLSEPIGTQKVLKKIEKSMQSTDKSWAEMIDQMDHNEQ